MMEELTWPMEMNYLDKVLKPELDLPHFSPEDFLGKGIGDSLDELWVKNYLENKSRIIRFPVTRFGHGKVAILIGASPAVKNQLGILRELDDNYVLICTPTTLKLLLDHEVYPDFVFAVEGRHHWISDLECDTRDLTLIASPFLFPGALRKWQGPVYFNILRGGKKYNELITADWEVTETGGGNSVSTSMIWALKYLGCRRFVFIGMSFCYYGNGNNYYYDGRPQQVENLKRWEFWKAMDIYGKNVYTTPTFMMYKMWLESAMKAAVENTQVEFVNCTEDGILGVWPEMVKKEDGVIYARRRYLPWLNILSLRTTIEAYNRMFEEESKWRSGLITTS